MGEARVAGRSREFFAVARGAKTPVVTDMNLHALPSGPIQTVGYLLTAPERGEAV